MVSITVEVSEKLAKFLTHPGIKERFLVTPGELIEDAFADALTAWAGVGWTLEKELAEMEAKD